MDPQAIEVEIDRAGRVHAVDPRVTVPVGPALLTPLQSRPSTSLPTRGEREDWQALIGVLAASPNWREEPQQIQQRLRWCLRPPQPLTPPAAA